MTNATLSTSIEQLSVMGAISSPLKVHNLTAQHCALQNRQYGPVVGL